MAEVKTVYNRENPDIDWFVINPATIEQDFSKEELEILSKNLYKLNTFEGLISKHDEFPDAQTKYSIMTFDTLDNANTAYDIMNSGFMERKNLLVQKKAALGQYITRVFIINDEGEIVNSDWPEFI